MVAGLARSERLVCMRWSDGDATAADAAVAAAPPQGQTRKSEPSPFVQYLLPYAGYGLLAYALASVAFAYLVLVGGQATYSILLDSRTVKRTLKNQRRPRLT